MSSKLSRAIALLAVTLIALTGASAAYGQVTTMRVHIPFEFIASGTTLPAGTYHVQLDPIWKRISLRSNDDKTAIYLGNSIADWTGDSADQGMLVFHKYGNSAFLRKMVNAGRSVRYEWPPSKAERQLMRETPLEVAYLHLSK